MYISKNHFEKQGITSPVLSTEYKYNGSATELFKNLRDELQKEIVVLLSYHESDKDQSDVYGIITGKDKFDLRKNIEKLHHKGFINISS